MAEQKQPLVTVVMPAYNAEAYVEKAIRSVIHQTYSNWELVVVDDRSTDGTYEIIQRVAAEDRRIKAYRNEQNMGVARSRNFGILQGEGKYVAFLDSDDVWLDEKLEQQIALAEKSKAGITYCSYAIIDAAGSKAKEDYIVPEKTDFEHMLRENVIACSAMVVRSDILKKIKFNTEFYHEDFVLALDILHAGYTAAGCKPVLLNWRYLDHSRSFNKKRSACNRWRVYRNYLKLPLLKSINVFLHYAMAGWKKYR